MQGLAQGGVEQVVQALGHGGHGPAPHLQVAAAFAVGSDLARHISGLQTEAAGSGQFDVDVAVVGQHRALHVLQHRPGGAEPQGAVPQAVKTLEGLADRRRASQGGAAEQHTALEHLAAVAEGPLQPSHGAAQGAANTGAVRQVEFAGRHIGPGGAHQQFQPGMPLPVRAPPRHRGEYHLAVEGIGTGGDGGGDQAYFMPVIGIHAEIDGAVDEVEIPGAGVGGGDVEAEVVGLHLGPSGETPRMIAHPHIAVAAAQAGGIAHRVQGQIRYVGLQAHGLQGRGQGRVGGGRLRAEGDDGLQVPQAAFEAVAVHGGGEGFRQQAVA